MSSPIKNENMGCGGLLFTIFAIVFIATVVLFGALGMAEWIEPGNLVTIDAGFILNHRDGEVMHECVTLEKNFFADDDRRCVYIFDAGNNDQEVLAVDGENDTVNWFTITDAQVTDIVVKSDNSFSLLINDEEFVEVPFRANAILFDGSLPSN